ncbi:MAG: right-handed parallel beta-helix repeat-containing protein [Saprospiraceae bacterium]|nr:right-handed parallel beta-helix repeat-containing protein [Saprospiraceae bacterium]
MKHSQVEIPVLLLSNKLSLNHENKKRMKATFTPFFYVILLFVLGIYYVSATNYHVSITGNDSNNGLTVSTPLRTIQAATNKVRAGDSVLVYNGNYTGFDHRDKQNGLAGRPIVYFAMGDRVIITTALYRNNGINIENNDYIHIIGFKVRRMLQEGIRAVYANHVSILYNECDSCYRGIFTGYTDDLLVEHNVCSRSHGEHGIYVSNNSDRAVVRYNSCSFNKASGIQYNPDLSSGAPGYSEDADISYNIVFENKRGAGLNLQGLSRALVTNNLIYNNHEASGITLFHGDASKGCTDVKVFNNTIIVPADGRWGIHVIDDAERIQIFNNVILNFHPWKGAIALQKNGFVQKEIISDYNYVSDKFCDIDDGCSKTLSFWQSLGYDLHSLKALMDQSLVFVNFNNKNYKASANSPLLDAGTDWVAPHSMSDLVGISRPQGSAYDIGCYEKVSISFVEDPSSASQNAIYGLFGWASFESLIGDQPTSKWMLFDINGRPIHPNQSDPRKLNLNPGIYILKQLPNGAEQSKTYFLYHLTP